MTVSQRFSHLREESTGFHLREAASQNDGFQVGLSWKDSGNVVWLKMKL